MFAQGLVAPPELRDQVFGAQAMPLKAAAHRKPSQWNRGSYNLIKRAIKVQRTPRCSVNLKCIGLKLRQQMGEVVEPHPVIGGFNQAQGAGR
jgi:hypothetical protein